MFIAAIIMITKIMNVVYHSTFFADPATNLKYLIYFSNSYKYL